MQEIKLQIPDGKRAEWVDGVLTLVDEKPQDVTERIKTFEDALDELEVRAANGDNTAKMLYDDWHNVTTDSGDLIAFLQLRIIAAALNEGWEPQFTKDEDRWFPWFTLWTEEELKDKTEEWKKEHSLWLFGGYSDHGAACGLASAYSSRAWSGSSARISARLAVKSEELAVYFGKQFIDIWADHVVIKK